MFDFGIAAARKLHQGRWRLFLRNGSSYLVSPVSGTVRVWGPLGDPNRFQPDAAAAARWLLSERQDPHLGGHPAAWFKSIRQRHRRRS